MKSLAASINERSHKVDPKHMNEDEKTQSAIKALVDAEPSDDNAEQGKFVSIMKGMAFSDDPEATAFMKKLMGKIDKSFLSSSKDEANIMAACKDLHSGSTDEEIDAVAKKSGHPADSIKKIAKGKKKMDAE